MAIEHMVPVARDIVLAGTVSRVAAQIGNEIDPENLAEPTEAALPTPPVFASS